MPNRVITVVIRGSVTGLQTAAAQGSAALLGMARTANTAAVTQSRALRTVGDTAGKIGLVAAAGLGAAVAAAANFDKSMSGVEAATHESAAGMEALRAAALKAGADTAFSATEAAGGIEALAKAGVSTSDILGGGLTGALDLAAAGSIGVQEAAEQAATAMTQFGKTGADVPHIADLLAAAAGKAQGEVTDFGQALNQSGLVANSMGISIEETTGALAAFASAGLLGSDAGTSLKSMLQRLANPSKEAADTMSDLGINAYDAQGNFVGLEGIAGQLKGSMKGLSAEQRDAAMATIFGSDAVRAANVLYTEGAKGIDSWTAKVNDQGYAAETAAIKLDNLRGDLEALGGSLETALIGTGEGSQGPLRGIVQGLTGVVNAYNELPPVAQSSVAGVLAATAVLGTGAFLGVKVISAITETRAALQALGISATTTRTMLANMGKGLAFGALLIGLGELDKLIDNLSGADFEIDSLGRSLDALSKGRVEGTVLKTLGEDLNQFRTDMELLDPTPINRVSGALDGLIPGSSGMEEAADRVKTLDEALAGMVESGQQAEASAIFDQLAAAAAKGGTSVDEVRAKFEQYQIALENAGGDGNFISGLIDGVANAIEGAGDSAGAAAPKVTAFQTALAGLSGMLDRRAAFRNQITAVDDFTAALRENGAALNATRTGFNRNTKAGLEQEAMFDNIISTTAQVAQHLHGIARVNYVDRQVAQARQMARALGLPRPVIDVLIGALKDLGHQKPKPKVDADTKGANRKLDETQGKADKLDRSKAVPTVDANNKPALGAMAGVNAGLSALDRRHVSPTVTANTGSAIASINNVFAAMSRIQNKSVTITTFHRDVGRQGIGDQTKAAGGYITGPGTATSDSIPLWGSNGEYMVRAAAVDHYGRGFLDRVNAMAYANGGLVTSSPAAATPSTSSGRHAAVGLSDRDINRLAAAMLKATREGTREGSMLGARAAGDHAGMLARAGAGTGR